MTASQVALARHHAHTAEQRAAAADLLGDLDGAPRFRVECVKTGRFWDKGLRSRGAADRAAIGLGLKDWLVVEVCP